MRECPDAAATIDATLALLPRGRAWQEPSGGPLAGSVMHGFFAGIGEGLHPIYARGCDLEREIFCSTAVETADTWDVEFGFPDVCLPADRCGRFRPSSGTTCERLVAAAEAVGFVVACTLPCARVERAGTARAGNGCGVGGLTASTIIVEIDLDASPGWDGQRRPRAGSARAGCASLCDPDLDGLACALDRIAPAHTLLVYRFAAEVPLRVTEDGTIRETEDAALRAPDL